MLTRRPVEIAARVLGSIAAPDVALGPMTTYRVGGSAALLATPRSLDDLGCVAEARAASGLPLLVIGKGSNMLVADSGFPGIAVSLAELSSGIELGDPDSDGVAIVTAGAAVSLPVLARRTAAAELTGFEWGVGIPGSIGGAVVMNAGGHGSDMDAVIVDATIIDLAADEPEARTAPREELGLRFRGSDVGALDVVLGARLRLTAGDAVAATERVSDIVRWRRANQPGGQNCGSVFVNPIPDEVSAGELIDGLGLRGLRIGSAEVSPKHANFIQADEGARSADVLAVMDEVRRRVAEDTGYRLRSEVRLVGFE